MNLLIWTQYFWPENFIINQLPAELKRQGANVTVLTGKPNYPDGFIYDGYRACRVTTEYYQDVEVIRLPVFPRKNNSFGLVLNYLSFIISGYLFASPLLYGKKFDAVFVYAPSPLLQALPAIFISWLKRAKLIVWVQDLWPESLSSTGYIKSRWVLKLIEFTVRYIYHFSDLILIQSQAFRPAIEKLVTDTNKIEFCPNYAEDYGTLLSRTREPNLIAVEIKQYFSVVFAGNIGSVQACETIVAAAEQLGDHPAVRFFLVGAGSRVEFIQQIIDIKNLKNIVLTGRQKPEDMPAILSAASVLLISLKKDPFLEKTVPSKLQCYMSADKPIVACINGEAAELVSKAGAGLVCPAEDSSALAAAVLKLYRMPPEIRKKLGRNAVDYYKKNYSLKVWLSKFAEFMLKIDSKK